MKPKSRSKCSTTLPCGHPSGCVQGRTTLYCGWCADRASMARYFGQIHRVRTWVAEALRRGRISEGQAMDILGCDRLEVRKIQP